MSEKLFKTIPAEKLEKMTLDKCYLLFFHNIEGIEYYAEPLGSPNRLARNINAIGLFKSYSDLETFYTKVSLNQILSNDALVTDFTIREKIGYYIVDEQEKMFENNDIITSIFKKINNEKDPINMDSDQLCRKFIENVPIYNEINYDTIDMLNEIVPVEYYTYILSKKFPTSIDVLRSYLYVITNMNYLFSVYAMSTNNENKTNLKCLEMTKEDLLKFWNLYIPDLDTDLAMLSEQNKEYVFPVYEVWKKLEAEFYNDIKDRCIDFDDIIKKIQNNDEGIDDSDEIIDFSKMF